MVYVRHNCKVRQHASNPALEWDRPWRGGPSTPRSALVFIATGGLAVVNQAHFQSGAPCCLSFLLIGQHRVFRHIAADAVPVAPFHNRQQRAVSNPPGRQLWEVGEKRICIARA